eukprot:CAMPEP_0118947990 /NCGR_PEP_ID=MMETSP1169-20130426/47040_1 /TAXON_ID=36882 /ORGANISM="Pyramimonas obovata, Strain CCMP722" /LENGTH=561 /DNA_ID=CAMNT_0006894319 /DNA_START=240 /DNA_END=1923 /DNA_ORIENTATION=-
MLQPVELNFMRGLIFENRGIPTPGRSDALSNHVTGKRPTWPGGEASSGPSRVGSLPQAPPTSSHASPFPFAPGCVLGFPFEGASPAPIPRNILGTTYGMTSPSFSITRVQAPWNLHTEREISARPNSLQRELFCQPEVTYEPATAVHSTLAPEDLRTYGKTRHAANATITNNEPSPELSTLVVPADEDSPSRGSSPPRPLSRQSPSQSSTPPSPPPPLSSSPPLPFPPSPSAPSPENALLFVPAHSEDQAETRLENADVASNAERGQHVDQAFEASVAETESQGQTVACPKGGQDDSDTRPLPGPSDHSDDDDCAQAAPPEESTIPLWGSLWGDTNSGGDDAWGEEPDFTEDLRVATTLLVELNQGALSTQAEEDDPTALVVHFRRGMLSTFSHSLLSEIDLMASSAPPCEGCMSQANDTLAVALLLGTADPLANEIVVDSCQEMPPHLLQGCDGVSDITAATLRHMETGGTPDGRAVVGWALCNLGYGPHLDERVRRAFSPSSSPDSECGLPRGSGGALPPRGALYVSLDVLKTTLASRASSATTSGAVRRNTSLRRMSN